jgi:hypothetical protein
MRGIGKWITAVTVLLMLTTLYGLDNGEKVKIRGLITGRNG